MMAGSGREQRIVAMVTGEASANGCVSPPGQNSDSGRWRLHRYSFKSAGLARE